MYAYPYGMNSTASAYTDSAIQRGFDNQAVMNKLNGLEVDYVMDSIQSTLHF